jgi:hypothetical protein
MQAMAIAIAIASAGRARRDRADTVAQKPAVISSVLPRCEWKIIRKIIVQ